LFLKNIFIKATTIVTLLIIITWLLFPYYWMFITALKSDWELYVYPPAFYPQEPTLKHFISFLVEKNGIYYFLNSIIVCSSVVILTLIIVIPAAYALTRYNVPQRFYRNILSFYLSQRFLPPIAIVIPLFAVIRGIGLYDSIYSLILSYTFFNIPLAIWLLSSYLKEVPKDIEEAALLDGLTRFRTFFIILLPLIFPQLVSTLILLFIFSWNEFLFALIFTATIKSQTLPIATWNLVTQFKIDWHAMAVAGILTSIVPAITFLSLRRYIIRGLTFGVVK